MPEGDTILALARRLHEALAGRTLTRTDFRVPSLATAELSGNVVGEVAARGKHLLMRLEGTDDVTIHSHLGMDGEWRVVPDGRRPRGPAHELRVILETDGPNAVGYRLPILEIIGTSREAQVLGHLGPDALGPDWSADEALRRLLADPACEVGVALIDQRVMAGPGNVYKSEACFLRGVHPRTPVGEVRDPRALVAMVKRLMEANRRGGPRVTTGDTRRGRALWVYGRAGEPCRRCGAPVERIVQGEEPGERSTYLCPSCQPAPGS